MAETSTTSTNSTQPDARAVDTARPLNPDKEYFVISVAAELTGMHAQTLRTYDRMGLVTPARTPGGGRRYSSRDITMLRWIQELSQEKGVNLAGIKTIIELTERVESLEQQLDETQRHNAELTRELQQNRHARRGGELVHVPRSTAVVTWSRRKKH